MATPKTSDSGQAWPQMSKLQKMELVSALLALRTELIGQILAASCRTVKKKN